MFCRGELNVVEIENFSGINFQDYGQIKISEQKFYIHLIIFLKDVERNIDIINDYSFRVVDILKQTIVVFKSKDEITALYEKIKLLKSNLVTLLKNPNKGKKLKYVAKDAKIQFLAENSTNVFLERKNAALVNFGMKIMDYEFILLKSNYANLTKSIVNWNLKAMSYDQYELVDEIATKMTRWIKLIVEEIQEVLSVLR